MAFALTTLPEGLEIAATCRVVELDRFKAPPEWKAASLFPECCRAFLASFKIWNEADRWRKHRHVAAGRTDDFS